MAMIFGTNMAMLFGISMAMIIGVNMAMIIGVNMAMVIGTNMAMMMGTNMAMMFWDEYGNGVAGVAKAVPELCHGSVGPHKKLWRTWSAPIEYIFSYASSSTL